MRIINACVFLFLIGTLSSACSGGGDNSPEPVSVVAPVTPVVPVAPAEPTPMVPPPPVEPVVPPVDPVDPVPPVPPVMPEPEPEPEPLPFETQAGLTIEIGDDVAERYRTEAREAILYAQVEAAKIYGVTAVDIFVGIHSNPEDMVDAYMWFWGIPESQREVHAEIFRQFPGFSGYKSIWHGLWIEWEWARGTWVHEYTHILQWELSENARGGRAPRWMEEGHAIHTQVRITDTVKNNHPDPNIEQWLAWVRPLDIKQGLGDIEEMDFYEVIGAGQLGALAVEYLRVEYGDMAMLDFWRELAKSPWRTAFETAFGISPTEFYNDFDEFRAQ